MEKYIENNAEKKVENNIKIFSTEISSETDNIDDIIDGALEKNKISDDVVKDDRINEYISSFKEKESQEIKKIKCRNEELEGKSHPETGVYYEKKIVDVDGEKCEVVAPKFDSVYDVQLPKSFHKEKDTLQFTKCNSELRNENKNNNELRETFSKDELEQIDNLDTPDGYTWHHDMESGKMQLVDTNIHRRTGHTGGKAIWGGGNTNR